MSKNIQFTDEELKDYEAHKGKMHGALLCKMLLEQREETRWMAKKYDETLLQKEEVYKAGLKLAEAITKERDDALRLNDEMLQTMNDLYSFLSLVRHRHLDRKLDLEKEIDPVLGRADKHLNPWWKKQREQSEKRKCECQDCGKALKPSESNPDPNLCLACCRKRWPDSPNCPLPHDSE